MKQTSPTSGRLTKIDKKIEITSVNDLEATTAIN
jgi:hypothetical protein